MIIVTPTNPNYLLPKAAIMKERRMKLGLTQKALAEKSKVSLGTISAYERNASQATPDSATALAKALDMELMDLFDAPPTTADTSSQTDVVEVLPCSTNPPLKITSQADDILKMAAVGLERDNGSPDRVSFAIANITSYLRSIIYRVPKLKENTQGLVDAITATLSTSVLDANCTSIEDLWSVMKKNLAELKALDKISTQARIEADSSIEALQKSRLENDGTQKLKAIKTVLYWLHDYWNLICLEQAAYNALAGVCCCLASAPTDYNTRSRLVAHVNTFATYVAMYDPVYIAMHKEEKASLTAENSDP